jgi:hypothetical protein
MVAAAWAATAWGRGGGGRQRAWAEGRAGLGWHSAASDCGGGAGRRGQAAYASTPEKGGSGTEEESGRGWERRRKRMERIGQPRFIGGRYHKS